MKPTTLCSLFLAEIKLQHSRKNYLFKNVLSSQKLFKYRLKSTYLEDSAKAQPIHKYIGNKSKRNTRLHVCGLTVTGACGVPELPSPENLRRERPRYKQIFPHPLVMNNIDNIACGYGYSLFSSKKSKTIKVWGCGLNTDSQLGFHKGVKPSEKTNLDVDVDKESYKYLMAPAAIPLPLKKPEKAKVIDIACGRAHTLVLTDTEGIFSFGNNAFGQCGRPIVDGEIYENSRKIHNIPHSHFPSPVVKVYCGMDHSLFLTKNGKVFSCGWGTDGQTGLGDVPSTSEPTLVKGDLDGVKIIQLSTFADTTLAVSADNNVFAWGNSEYGQFSCVSDSTQVLLPTHMPFTKQKKITEVAVGGTACMLLNEQGEVWVWGYGILGKGPDLQSSTWPSLIPPTLFGLSELRKDVHVTKIICGLNSLGAVTNTGELYTWGKNRKGCLGIGTHRDQYFPWRVILGNEVIKARFGVDHMVILSKCLL